MKVLMTGPNINDDKKLGGIISFIKIYLQNFSGQPDYFARSASQRSATFFMKFIAAFKKALQSTAYDFVHINTALNLSAIVRDLVISSNVPGNVKKIIHIHGGKYIDAKPGFFTGLLIEKLINNNTVIVLSETEKKFLAKHYNAKEILVLKNAVTIPFKAPTDKPGLIVEEIKSPMTICYIGRIDEYKGLDFLFEALCKLQQRSISFTFSLYGDGPARSGYVKQYTAQFGDSFFYGGIVHGNDKTEAFLKSSVFVLPSLFEGLPMALLEAMALGRIVIATRVGSIPTLITDKSNGFLVSPRDEDELSRALMQLVDMEAINEISRNALKTIVENYNAETLDTSIMTIYKAA